MSQCFENDINDSNPLFPSFLFDSYNLFNEPFSIFGFTLFFEDILILALAFFLLSQENCDMLLVGVLFLILFS